MTEPTSAAAAAPTCQGCGAPADPDSPIPSRCGHCPPWTCETCGEQCSAADLCSCWIRLENLAPADVKALFAQDGTFNIETDGRLTVADGTGGDDA